MSLGELFFFFGELVFKCCRGRNTATLDRHLSSRPRKQIIVKRIYCLLAMESTERLVRTWMGTGRIIEIQETVSGTHQFSESTSTVTNFMTGIASGQITLLNIVKALGEYLTAEEDELRTKGNVKILGNTFHLHLHI